MLPLPRDMRHFFLGLHIPESLPGLEAPQSAPAVAREVASAPVPATRPAPKMPALVRGSARTTTEARRTEEWWW